MRGPIVTLKTLLKFPVEPLEKQREGDEGALWNNEAVYVGVCRRRV